MVSGGDGAASGAALAAAGRAGDAGPPGRSHLGLNCVKQVGHLVAQPCRRGIRQQLACERGGAGQTMTPGGAGGACMAAQVLQPAAPPTLPTFQLGALLVALWVGIQGGSRGGRKAAPS